MICVKCFQTSDFFVGMICADCYPQWYLEEWGSFKPSTCTFGNCNIAPVSNRIGLCTRHRKDFWQAGGVCGGKGKFFNPDGTRKVCSEDGCLFVAETSGLCRHHYQSEYYEKTRGLTKSKKYLKKTNYDGTPVLCDFPDCDKPVFNQPWCAGHYYQNLRGKELSPLGEKADCAIPGCENLVSVKLNTHRICGKHRGFQRRFSLSDEKLFELHFEENLKCQNLGCGRTENLHLDHDHSCCPYRKNGVRCCGSCVRGWLCQGCNVSLGFLQENPQRIRGLLEYLNSY